LPPGSAAAHPRATAAPPPRRRPEPHPRRHRCHRRPGSGPPRHDRIPRGTHARSPMPPQPARLWSVLGLVVERTDLDGHGARLRGLAAPFERGVEILGLDDPEAADLFLALGERTVHGEHLPVLDAQDGGGARGMQAPGEHPSTGGLHLLVQGVDVPPRLLLDLGRKSISFGVIHAEQVLLHLVVLLGVSRRRAPAFILYTNGRRPYRHGFPGLHGPRCSKRKDFSRQNASLSLIGSVDAGGLRGRPGPRFTRSAAFTRSG